MSRWRQIVESAPEFAAGVRRHFDAHLFRAEIYEAVLIGLDEGRKRLVIELWRPDRELQRIERD